MSTDEKPPITCHVLDTTRGRPASSIPVLLTLHNPSASLSASSALQFSAQTNSDGRVTSWKSATAFEDRSVEDVFRAPGDQRWSLKFDTEAYFAERGVKTFFPEVVVGFVVRQDGSDGESGSGKGKTEHYHVPILLGPFGYTTYRGS